MDSGTKRREFLEKAGLGFAGLGVIPYLMSDGLEQRLPDLDLRDLLTYLGGFDKIL